MSEQTTKPRLTDQFAKAMIYAERKHHTQVRKGGDIPYVGHLLSVASLVINDNGSEAQAIAALLHDAVEDQGGRVVGDAFAVQHQSEPARQAEAADDGERRDRIGRRHDGTQHEADGKRHAEHEMRDRGHRSAGEQDATES